MCGKLQNLFKNHETNRVNKIEFENFENCLDKYLDTYE